MTSWQKRLRVGVAIFGIVFAGLVYRSIGERRIAAPTRPVDRLDPKAILETRKGTAGRCVAPSRNSRSRSDAR